MRITFLSAALDLSGGSRIISTYAKSLADRGHQVCIVARGPQPPTLRQRLRSVLRHGRWDPHMGSPSHADGLGLDIRRIDHRPIAEGDVPDADVLIATWWETAEWSAPFADRKGRKVYFVQGHEVFDFLPVERARATYHLPYKKIVVSGWLQRIMAQTYGDHDTMLVPNSVDHAVFDAPPRGKQARPTVGFMFSPGSIKGADMMLAAVQRLRRSVPDLRVVAFGAYLPGADDDFTGIEFQHRPSAEQLRAAYASADVWLCGSRSEGFGLPAMEAMGCRTPLVSTPVGWPMDEIRDGENGYLVPFDDAQAMADAAQRILSLDDLAWRQMSDNARQSSRRYSWERSTQQFEAALQAVVHAGR